MKNDELKPCPFCGGKAEVFFNKANELWYVCCYDEYNDFDCCEINTTWYSNKEDAIEAWNTRTEPKEQDVCTGKVPVDKIREAFEEVYEESKNFVIGPMPDIEDMWMSYQAGHRLAQAEIKRLEAENEAMRCCGKARYIRTYLNLKTFTD